MYLCCGFCPKKWFPTTNFAAVLSIYLSIYIYCRSGIRIPFIFRHTHNFQGYSHLVFAMPFTGSIPAKTVTHPCRCLNVFLWWRLRSPRVARKCKTALFLKLKQHMDPAFSIPCYNVHRFDSEGPGTHGLDFHFTSCPNFTFKAPIKTWILSLETVQPGLLEACCSHAQSKHSRRAATGGTYPLPFKFPKVRPVDFWWAAGYRTWNVLVV